MKYLVTGGAGFIGSHLVEKLLTAGNEVVAIDSFDETLRPAISRRLWSQKLVPKDGLRFIEGDLSSLALDDLLDGVDVVIHQAATPGLIPSWSSFDKYLQNNVLSTQLLAEAVSRSGVRKVVNASTSSVYGLMAIGDESLPTKPISPYGISKLASEMIWRASEAQIRCPITTLRYFSVYGPRQRTDMAWSIFIEKLVTEQEIEVTGDGRQSRTSTFVGDVVEATIAAGSPDSPSGVFNICGDEEVSVLTALDKLSYLLNTTPRITFVERRRGDQAQTRGINDAAKTKLGFENKTSFVDGLKAQVDWAMQHPYW